MPVRGTVTDLAAEISPTALAAVDADIRSSFAKSQITCKYLQAY